MRLIDADKLIKSYRKLAALKWNQTVFPKSWADAYESFIDDIEEAPTIQPQGIDKDRLIEFLKEQLRDWEDMKGRYVNGADCGFDAIDEVLDWVNQQSTTDGWIPCSMRLPSKEEYSEDGFVLVQTGGDIIYKGFYEAESGFWVDEVGFKFAYMPIAWQPLPQPFKESE